jgi:Tfp pilus assembly protein PilO
MILSNIKVLDRICILAVIGILCTGGYTSVTQASREHRQVQQENELLAKRAKDVVVTEKCLQRLNILLESTRTELQELDASIPDSDNIGEFLKEMDLSTRERGMVLITVQPLPAIQEELYTKIPFHLIFKGSFGNICLLLQDLESMKRTMVMEKMSIYRSPTSPECTVDLTASVFQR